MSEPETVTLQCRNPNCLNTWTQSSYETFQPCPRCGWPWPGNQTQPYEAPSSTTPTTSTPRTTTPTTTTLSNKRNVNLSWELAKLQIDMSLLQMSRLQTELWLQQRRRQFLQRRTSPTTTAYETYSEKVRQWYKGIIERDQQTRRDIQYWTKEQLVNALLRINEKYPEALSLSDNAKEDLKQRRLDERLMRVLFRLIMGGSFRVGISSFATYRDDSGKEWIRSTNGKPDSHGCGLAMDIALVIQGRGVEAWKKFGPNLDSYLLRVFLLRIALEDEDHRAGVGVPKFMFNTPRGMPDLEGDWTWLADETESAAKRLNLGAQLRGTIWVGLRYFDDRPNHIHFQVMRGGEFTGKLWFKQIPIQK